MDLNSRFLCNTVLYSIRFYFHHQTYPQLSIISALAQLRHCFWSYGVVLHSSPAVHWTPYNLGALIFWYHIFLPFYAVFGLLTAILLKRFAISSSSGSCFVRTLHSCLQILVSDHAVCISSLTLFRSELGSWCPLPLSDFSMWSPS